MTINVFGGGYNPLAPVFPVQRSVRLRSSASAYFNRTPASATNRQKYTLSLWVKRGALGTNQALFSASDGTQNNEFLIYFDTNNALGFQQTVGGSAAGQISCFTNAVFRDPSAWYHVVVAIDTTQATSTNRLLLYINGVAQTFSSYSVGSSINTWVDNTNPHAIGKRADASLYFDGYLTEINFIDGQQLTPTSFGSYNAGSGVWQPIRYSGTYGTNGFYLNFQDNSAATAAAIGKDSSGNGNNWTPNNISVTAGVTYDSMVDVPTLTSPTNANFAVMNPLKKYTSNLGLTNGNLTASDSNPVVTSAISTMSFGTSGKYYFECTMVAVATANSNYVGVIDAANGFGTAPFQNKGEYRSTGDIYNIAGTAQTAGASYTTNDIIGVAVDVTNGTVQFYKNNVAQGATPSFTFTAGTELWAAISTDNQVGTKTYALNFGQRPFTFTAPTGFLPLNTYNLATPTIPNGATQFAAKTYTGTAAALTVTNTVNSVSFQPDFVWIKDRTSALNHRLLDSVRGTTSLLYSNTTDAQVTIPNANDSFSSFNSNGFTLGVGQGMNASGDAYIGWQWKANGTPAVTNTNGTIPSTISANTTSGFSIVTYTGTGANATVGHGLGIAPKMVIVKARNFGSATDWAVYHSGLTSAAYAVFLNTTGAQSNAASWWNSTAPSSTVFSIGTSGGAINGSGTNYVAYCFAEIAGYSKFGLYTGNGSTDGPFVYTGMRPRWVMIKRTDTTGDWVIWDTSRNTYNAAQNGLYPNLSVAEGNSYFIDVLSNGFKLRMSTIMNVSSGTYIFAAFAENPFTYSLAR